MQPVLGAIVQVLRAARAVFCDGGEHDAVARRVPGDPGAEAARARVRPLFGVCRALPGAVVKFFAVRSLATAPAPEPALARERGAGGGRIESPRLSLPRGWIDGVVSPA